MMLEYVNTKFLVFFFFPEVLIQLGERSNYFLW